MRQRYIASRKISIHLMLLFIIPGRVEEGKKDMFQYISCYSLSVAAEQSPVLVAAFQYISCYSLSDQEMALLKKNNCFNASHVTLYQI